MIPFLFLSAPLLLALESLVIGVGAGREVRIEPLDIVVNVVMAGLLTVVCCGSRT